MQPNSQLDYTPMPGEFLDENQAEREKALAEKEAIANGENFNPNLSDEDAEAFSSLADEVPFAGDIQQQAKEQEERQEQTEGSTGNALKDTLNTQWAAGSMDIEAAKNTVESNYIDGAVEQSTEGLDAEADIAEASKDATSTPDAEQPKNDNQPREIVEAAAMKAVAADVLSKEVAKDIAASDTDSLSKAKEVEQRAAEAEALADKITSTATNNSSSEDERRMAEEARQQVYNMTEEARTTVNEAQDKLDSMSEEEIELAEEAAKRAEENGTDVETEKENLQRFKTEQANQKNLEDKENEEDWWQNRMAA